MLTNKLPVKVAVIFVLVVTLLSTAAPALAYQRWRVQPLLPVPGSVEPPASRPYIHPALLDRGSSYWETGALADNRSLLARLPSMLEEIAARAGVKVHRPSTPVARALILLPAKAPAGLLEAVRRSVVFVSAVYPTHVYTIVSALVTPESVEKLAKTPGVLAVLPDLRADLAIGMRGEDPRNPQFIDSAPGSAAARPSPEALTPAGGEKPLPAALGVAAAPGVPDYGLGYHYTVNLTGAARVWEEYNETGSLAKIAIIDTGVDYASPGLGEDAIARDSYGLPMILDMSGGLVFFPVNATIVNSTTIYVNASGLYAWLPLYEYFVKGDFAFAMSTDYVEYNLTGYYTVPEWAVNASLETGLPIRFGVAYQTIMAPVGIVVVSAPAIIVPDPGTGYYTTLILDLSTAAYYLNQSAAGAFTVPGAPSAPDRSFADETPVTYGSEIAARDFDGDGYYDLSFGALAGYEYDAYGLVLAAKLGVLDEVFAGLEPGFYYLGQITAREQWDMENIGGFWLGIDLVSGRYAALEYDFHSHGTFCATTAAGRPVPAVTGYGTAGPFATVVGQAPSAKIAAANFFFTGDALAAVYWFDGLDLVNEYSGLIDAGSFRVPVPSTENGWIGFLGYAWHWSPTGDWHRADMTSNSWGASGWALWGWASGYDPVSVGFDYASMVTGTPNFVAAGNGGSGYGTVTVPGSSTTAITVGAATEFTYRPLYGYMVGGNREVISWSDRGPAETGLSKPDIVAIGSFAYAVGRTWDSLAWGELSGNPVYTVDLFGGTSQATPMTAGAAALLVSYLKNATNATVVPFTTLKTLLMSSASDMGFNPISQGSGFIDIYTAVEKAANLTRGSPTLLAWSSSVYRYYSRILSANLDAFTYNPPGTLAALPSGLAETKLVLAGPAGSRASADLTVLSPTAPRVEPVKLVKTLSAPLCSAPGVVPVLDCSGTRVMLPLGSLGTFALVPLAIIDPAALEGYDLVRFYAYYPFKYFDDGGRYYNASHTIYYNGLELWYWVDANRDGVIELNETARIQYDLRGANAFTLEVGHLRQQLEEIERLARIYMGYNTTGAAKALLLVYRVWYNDWSGTSAVAPLTVTVEGYRLQSASEVRVLPAGGSGGTYRYVVAARLPRVPGVWEYYIRVSGGNDTILVPLTLVSDARMGLYGYTINGRGYRAYDEGSLYRNTMLRGAFDYTWRYESGDWRVFPILVTSPAVKALVVDVYWPVGSNASYASNLDVAVFGPHRYMMALGDPAANVTRVEPVPVNGLELGAELSSSHTVFWDDPEPGHTRIVVPVDGPGRYLVVVRNLQFSGSAAHDSFTVRIRVVNGYEPVRSAAAGSTATVTVGLRLPPGLVTSPDTVSGQAMGDAFLANRSGLFYASNASWIGVEVGNATTVARIYRGFTVVQVTVPVTLSSSLRGSTVYPVIGVALPAPVTSVGSISHGEVSPYYYWNIIGFTPGLRVR